MSLRSEVIRIINEVLALAKKISGLPSAGTLDGTELVEVVKDGVNSKTTTQDIADLGGGGGGSGTVESVTGDGVDNTDPDNPVLSFPTPGDIGAEVAGAAADALSDANDYTDSSIATEVTNRNAAIATAVTGLMNYRGVFDASVNAYPSSGGSGSAGAILKSNFWIISVAGTLPTGLVVAAGDLVIAKQDTPGNTEANWSIVEYNIGFTPVNKAGDTMGGNLAMGGNKVTGLAAASGNGEALRYEQVVGVYSTLSGTETLTNKRLTARVQAVTSSATVTPNADNDDAVKVTAQAAGLTLANPSGTPTAMQALIIRIKDNGTARSISYGTQYRAIGVTLPTTTVISKTIYLGLIWNADDSKWDVIGYSLEA